jgi:hypothetical protein
MNRHRRKDKSRGQALVEFALVVPMFLLLLFAIVDMGRYVYASNSLNQAAREAARIGSVVSRPECTATARDTCVNEVARSRVTGFGLKAGMATSGAQDAMGVYVQCRRWDGLNPGAAVPTFDVVSMANCHGGDILVVQVNHEFTLVTPLIGQFLGNQDLYGRAEVTVN